MFEVHITYPNEERFDDGSEMIQKRKEIIYEAAAGTVMERYQSFVRQGYSVTPAIVLGEEVDIDPFEFSEKLDRVGIDYKASLKFKNKSNQGIYDEILKIGERIESHGFDYDVNIKLKISEDSPVNFAKETSWFGPDSMYTISPKVSSKDAREIRGTYDDLVALGCDVTVDIKPVKANEDTFPRYLETFPEGSLVSMNLKDA